MKLLIVDDSSIMRRTIESHLNGQSIEIVGTASNGIEALQIVKEKRPDAVTLDITMPEMDGLTCLEKILEIAPQTKVMIITALSDKLTGLLALDKGAKGYLHKPVNADDLKKAFEKFLN